MAGLQHILNIGSESMFTNRQGIDTTAHNIANAQTEGYSRQRVELTQRPPIDRHGMIIGNGVFVGGIQRSHDRLLEKQLNIATSEQGSSGARLDEMQRLEALLSPELQHNVSSALGQFFSAWQDVAKYPEEMNVRSQLREQAQNLSDAFASLDFSLKQQRDICNEQIAQLSSEVTHNLETIAHLNRQISEMEVGISNQSNDLRDGRDRALRELSERINIHYYLDRNGMVTVHGPDGTLLVDKHHHARLEVAINPDRPNIFDVHVTDFSGEHSRTLRKGLESGALAGLIEVRDNVLTPTLERTNILAAAVSDHVNTVHRRGFGIGAFANSSGRDFFRTLPPGLDAAQNMVLGDAITQSPDAISAASVPNSIGDNIVANEMIRLKDAGIFFEGRGTFDDFYAKMVGDIGVLAMRAAQMHDADKVISADLISKREAVAGVSLDEEAANLIRWQTAFTASSKVITTVDEMYETVLGLKR